MKVLNEVNFIIYEVLITLDILIMGLENVFRGKKLYASSYPPIEIEELNNDDTCLTMSGRREEHKTYSIEFQGKLFK